MRGLNKRLEALEATRGSDLSHLSDEAIDTRIAELTAQIESARGLMHPDWRGMMARGEYRALYGWEMQCGV